MCRQRRDLNTNHENKGNALHSRNQTSDVLFLFRYSRTFRMKISARICMWLAGGGGKKGSICMLRHASRTNGKRALALDRDEKEKRAEKGNKDESVRNTFACTRCFCGQSRRIRRLRDYNKEFTHDSSRASIFGYMTLLLFRSSNFDIFESTLLGNSQARAAVIPIITSFSLT